ncbi:unnamed protein product [Caenorhabditis sp. 36 PRJEB53466]|nr:unnamed protein product [Caenorhabditis sp. 36 PRJEB53466]
MTSSPRQPHHSLALRTLTTLVSVDPMATAILATVSEQFKNLFFFDWKPRKTRKTVRFADTCGRELCEIRVAAESSDCPPTLDPSVLERYRTDGSEEEHKFVWIPSFPQPAADFTRFLRTLLQNKVALENVVVNGTDVLGTVKVANMESEAENGEKSVFVRYTTNGWASYLDKSAVENARVRNTSTFDFEIPGDGEQVEFCICFKTNDGEYWDSNKGNNYILNRMEM